MPTITVLTSEEIAERAKHPISPAGRRGPRRSEDTIRSIEACKAGLPAAELGASADVNLEPGETKARVREHLKLAAAELDRALAFKRLRDPARLHFQIITREEHAALPRRGGRRPKNAQPVSVDAEQQPFALVEDHDA